MIIWMQDGPDESSPIVEGQDELLRRAAEICLDREGIPQTTSENVAVSLSFVDEEEIRDLNDRFRGVDKVTDVLSFPMTEGREEILAAPPGQEIPIGDVVICADKIIQQAEEYGHSRTRELVYLFVHSMLHLLGYDHMEEDDKKRMRTAEEDIMKQMGIERQEL